MCKVIDCTEDWFTPVVPLKTQLFMAKQQLSECVRLSKIIPQNDYQCFLKKHGEDAMDTWKRKVKELKELLRGYIAQVASPLRFSHTSSMSFRIWYFGRSNQEELKFRETHFGTTDDIQAYIEHAQAVRIDKKSAEYDWTTIWLTDIRYVNLQGGHND